MRKLTNSSLGLPGAQHSEHLVPVPTIQVASERSPVAQLQGTTPHLLLGSMGSCTRVLCMNSGTALRKSVHPRLHIETLPKAIQKGTRKVSG